MQLPELFGQAIPLSGESQNFVPDDYRRELFLPNSRPFVLFEPVRCLRIKNPLFLAYGALHRFPDIGISSENEKDIDGLLSKAKKQLKLKNFDMAEKFIEEAKTKYLNIIPPRMLDLKTSHPNILYTICLLENARNLNPIGERFGSIQRARVNLPQSLPNQGLTQTVTNLFKENWQKELDQLFKQLLPLVDNEDNALLEVVYHKRHILCERSQKRQKLNIIGAYFKNIYSTVAIENVPTSLQDVANSLKDGFNFLPSNFSNEIRSREEIVGAAQAYCRILTKCKDGPLSVELLHDLHRLLVSGVQDLAEHAGVFKIEDKEGLGEHNNTQLYEAPLNEFLDWYNRNAVAKINKGEVDPILIVTLMHGFFVSLHPYKDGNGRLSRLIMNFVLIKAGFPPIRISEGRKTEYYDANDDFFRGEPRTFYRFLCNCIMETIKDYLDTNMATIAGAASPTEAEQSRGLVARSDKLSSSSKIFISLDSDSSVIYETIWPMGVNSSLCAAADGDFDDVSYRSTLSSTTLKEDDSGEESKATSNLSISKLQFQTEQFSQDIQRKLLPKPSDYDCIDWPNIILQEIAKLGTSSTVTDSINFIQ